MTISVFSRADTGKNYETEIVIFDDPFIDDNQAVLQKLEAQNIDWWSASSSQVSESPCRNNVPIEQQAIDFLNSF